MLPSFNLKDDISSVIAGICVTNIIMSQAGDTALFSQAYSSYYFRQSYVYGLKAMFALSKKCCYPAKQYKYINVVYSTIM